jgi:alpha-galactosidase
LSKNLKTTLLPQKNNPMNRLKILIFTTGLLLCSCFVQAFTQSAPTPPMGWNSYNCFGATVTGGEMRANAKMMAVHLKDVGWQYVVVDYCWSYPHVGALNNPPQTDDFEPRLAMDAYGRLLPALDRFPSAADGLGFKALGDYIHSLGLKFGIHVMRGIPRQAVAEDTPIFDSNYSAADIVDRDSECEWLDNMYGLNFENEGSQDYYNSLFKLYASWGVDYVKVDDILAHGPYHDRDIEALRKAIDQCGREMVLSLSPGAAPIDRAEHLKANANMWRMSPDFWDQWPKLVKMFDLAEQWYPHVGAGTWPDADMIPIGKLSLRGPEGPERRSRFTQNEQRTLWALWSIFRSPLMYGGDLTQMRPFELEMMRNEEMLYINQQSANNRPLFRRGNHIAWTADDPQSDDIFLAVFNLGEDDLTPVYVPLDDLGLFGTVRVRDIFWKTDLDPVETAFLPVVGKHEGRLYRLSP